MILVTGATGNIGVEVVRRLVGAERAVRVLARDPAKAARLLPAVEIARGDLHDPASVEAALTGVESAFLLAEALELPAIARTFAAAATRAGVGHVVLNSSGTIDIGRPTRLGAWHLEAEEALKDAGLAWTMLRPGNFATNTLRWAATIRAQGAVFAPGESAWNVPIDPRDIGAVAAQALMDPAHRNRTYLLTGPAAMTVHEQVDTIGRAIGKVIRVVEVPEARARAGMLAAGLSEVLVEAILELTRPGEHSDTAITTTIRDVTGEAPRTFADWVRDHASAFA